MAIDVAIVSEFGDEVEVLHDPSDLTSRLAASCDDEASPCLRFIDPYGDTVFNLLQIPLLIQEISESLERITDVQLKQHAQAIIDLANKTDIHHYVKFIGE